MDDETALRPCAAWSLRVASCEVAVCLACSVTSLADCLIWSADLPGRRGQVAGGGSSARRGLRCAGCACDVPVTIRGLRIAASQIGTPSDHVRSRRVEGRRKAGSCPVRRHSEGASTQRSFAIAETRSSINCNGHECQGESRIKTCNLAHHRRATVHWPAAPELPSKSGARARSPPTRLDSPGLALIKKAPTDGSRNYGQR